MIRACSHLVIASKDVGEMTRFFSTIFSIKPHFQNDGFSEFILPSRFRIAFFKPLGTATQHFSIDGTRNSMAIGITVEDVDAVYALCIREKMNTSGPPKDHPWGERSFLLIDLEENRWEITQSPASDGLLVEKTMKQVEL